MAKKYFRTSYSPITYDIDIKRSEIKNKCGIPKRNENSASQVKIGDIFINYLVGLSRFVGLCEITSKAKLSDENLYYLGDPYEIQFEVNSILLPIEHTISIHERIIWDNLSITKGLERSNRKWGGSFYGSINRLKDDDGQLLENLLRQQQSNPTNYPLSSHEEKVYNGYLKRDRPSVKNSIIETSQPEEDEKIIEIVEEDLVETTDNKKYYKSSEIQALIAKIGYNLKFQIWLPNHDRNTIKVLTNGIPDDIFINELPYDISDVVKQIDVLWVKGRTIVRAFEVEGTTAIYSGILRMSDLVEENPNINTSLHIVAAEERKEQVFRELSRPTFSKLQSRCSYISYDVIEKLANNEDLEYLKESIIDKYAEYPEYL